MAWADLASNEIPTKADVQEVIPTIGIRNLETLNTPYGNLFKIQYSNFAYPIIFGSLRIHISAGDGEGIFYTFPTAYQIYCNGGGGFIVSNTYNDKNYAHIFLNERNISYQKHGSGDKGDYIIQINNRALNLFA